MAPLQGHGSFIEQVPSPPQDLGFLGRNRMSLLSLVSPCSPESLPRGVGSRLTSECRGGWADFVGEKNVYYHSAEASHTPLFPFQIPQKI